MLDDSSPVCWRHDAELAVVTVAALGLALALPLATSVFALLLFGVLHNHVELRYIVGGFSGLFTRRLCEATLLGLTVVVVTIGVVGLLIGAVVVLMMRNRKRK